MLFGLDIQSTKAGWKPYTLIIDHMQMVLSVANKNYGFLKKFEKHCKKTETCFCRNVLTLWHMLPLM